MKKRISLLILVLVSVGLFGYTNEAKGVYVLDGYGGIHAGGLAAPITTTAYFGWDIAKAIETSSY